MALTQVPLGMMTSDAQYTGFKNRIINGNMGIDQRNAGVSVSPLSGYCLDRWIGGYLGSGTGRFSAQQSSTAPTGFKNSVVLTVTTADAAPSSAYGYYFSQAIEGYNVADMGFGASGAATFTVSFWVRSSLTGTFPVIVDNYASTRSYGATYTINSANTWEQKSVTVVGDTSGTWTTSNSGGITLIFGLGGGSSRTLSPTTWTTGGGSTQTNVTGCSSIIGTNGATFYITGVQLEKGSNATAFDYRPYGTELALCQRYYEQKAADGSSYSMVGWPYNAFNTNGWYYWFFKVSKRATPTITGDGYTAAHASLDGVTFVNSSSTVISSSTLKANAEL